jgi:hypothetical protein
MRKHLALVASAAMAVGGFMMGSQVSAQNASDSARQSADSARQAADSARVAADRAVVAVPAPDADDIRKTIATATEAAVTKEGFDDLVERFVDHDRDRIKSYASGKFPDLDGRIDQFLKDWKSKYNQDFSMSRDRNNILGDAFARISQGEIGEARTAAGKEVPSDQPKVVAGSAEDLKKSGVAATDANSNKTFGGETKKEPGRNIATVTIPASHGMPEMAVPLIHELPDTWKIDLPDNIDGPRLHDNVLKHLTMVDESRQNWPADVNDAYRIVTQHMMAALFDTGEKAMSPSTPMPMGNAPAAPTPRQ